jgi:hypothetical protein
MAGLFLDMSFGGLCLVAAGDRAPSHCHRNMGQANVRIGIMSAKGFGGGVLRSCA